MQEHHKQAIWAIVLAMVGGLLGYLMRTQKSGHKVRLSHAALQTVSSGFVGYLVCHLGRALSLDTNWMAPVIGVAGWIGALGAMKLLETIVGRKLGIAAPAKE